MGLWPRSPPSAASVRAALLRQFKAVHGITPSQLRARYRPCTSTACEVGSGPHQEAGRQRFRMARPVLIRRGSTIPKPRTRVSSHRPFRMA